MQAERRSAAGRERRERVRITEGTVASAPAAGKATEGA
jgi:hypothetical protein